MEEKDRANFCEYFDFSKRTWVGPEGNTREDAARAALGASSGLIPAQIQAFSVR